VEQAASADAVFTGTVAAVADAGGGVRARIFNFDVDTVYKGPVEPSIDVRSAESGSICGVEFKVDERYTVFAQGPENDLSANSCGGNPFVGDINPAKLGLGPDAGQTPGPDTGVHEPIAGIHRPLSPWLIVFTVVVGVVAVAAIVLVARRRRSASDQPK
jgi:hypothetical protein